MSDAPPEIRPVPGPRFTSRMAVSTWIDQSPETPISWLLLAHAGPRLETEPAETAESVETGLLGMVDAMRMSPAAERVPSVGPRLHIGRLITLDYGHPRYLLRLPSVGADWRERAARGALVCLTLILDPLPPGAGPDATAAILDRCIANGRAYMGAVTARTR
ncbi:hypothetical protein OOK39_21715 [Streptomyces sp. NBC_00264]|uniref:hypothetical protein n=1 Tax=unclassified Streptomyces TaxID=2593676 RepID=UPI0022513965|nr:MULTISPECIES: hypothetical protein [unclassified Streptomyces]MCX5161856.1 hypothetical protein [Streptomyces sp. NBC_00305]MCX5220379.1 hypothetical protein [Streptomyces sp. NBC_00264]